MVWKTGTKILLCIFVYILITSIFLRNKKPENSILNNTPPTITRGVDIPIISEEQARAEKPDYFLILPWHFIKEFKERERRFGK